MMKWMWHGPLNCILRDEDLDKITEHPVFKNNVRVLSTEPAVGKARSSTFSHSFSCKPWEADVPFSISQLRKLRQKDIKQLALCHQRSLYTVGLGSRRPSGS